MQLFAAPASRFLDEAWNSGLLPARFEYLYGFGDSWEHDLMLEAILLPSTLTSTFVSAPHIGHVSNSGDLSAAGGQGAPIARIRNGMSSTPAQNPISLPTSRT
jgi:hypothetical protein